jgi:hypothetical protein
MVCNTVDGASLEAHVSGTHLHPQPIQGHNTQTNGCQLKAVKDAQHVGKRAPTAHPC